MNQNPHDRNYTVWRTAYKRNEVLPTVIVALTLLLFITPFIFSVALAVILAFLFLAMHTNRATMEKLAQNKYIIKELFTRMSNKEKEHFLMDRMYSGLFRRRGARYFLGKGFMKTYVAIYEKNFSITEVWAAIDNYKRSLRGPR